MSQNSGLPDYDKLGSFYLGRQFELAGRKLLDEKILYDSKDLTTHAMCVGMTGSGKTGLCLSLLEEAALDGIPAICVDPKGDLGNLLLAFPELEPEQFEPWLEQSEADRKGMDLAAYAADTAAKWKSGLASWDQQPERIKRYRDAVDIAIYTPGSNAGIPMTVLKSFDAPPQVVIDDADVYRERVSGAASGILTLLGIDADPLTSREHILLSNIFDHAWRQGKNLDLAELIRSIQTPPISKIGVFDLESFFPAAERLKLSMSLNNLLASPAFSSWLEGQPLDIRSLMYTNQGKPRLSIINIAHLNDSERMFFVTILLNELIGWMRSQPGTTSLRAIFYMDEVFGYFPPTAKPPTKTPMLMLLKQARAFGLGICLATQNPVDLDYKGLANIGTWFLGRLQTQRDKDRVLEGLEGAASQTGARFDRGAMEQTLAALGSRVFLMNNVHEDAPVVFQSRWAMSFLCGPLSRTQIQDLMKDRRAELTPAAKNATANQSGSASPTADAVRSVARNSRPIIPNDVPEQFWIPARRPSLSAKLLYRPALLANVSCRYVRTSINLDSWLERSLLLQPKSSMPDDVWQFSQEIPQGSLELAKEPESGFEFADVPAEMLNGRSYKAWSKDLSDHLFRRLPVTIYSCPQLKAVSELGQDELDARMGWQQLVREKRDEEKELLRQKYGKLRDALEAKIRAAEQRLEREKAEYDQEKWSSALNIGTTILGSLLGRKIGARTTSAGRSVGRATRSRTDVLHATENLQDLESELHELTDSLEHELLELNDRYRVENLVIEPIEVPCRKGDIQVSLLCLMWIPYEVGDAGRELPLVELPQ